MPDPKSTKATRQIAVSAEAWAKAKKMAGLRTAKDQDGDGIGDVATDAILTAWQLLPEEVREFLERPEPAEAQAA